MTHDNLKRLQGIIKSIIACYAPHRQQLQDSARDLSMFYRQQQFDQALPEFKHVLSYLAVRLPATYSVMDRVFEAIAGDDIQSMLDIGTGPGTAIWSALNYWPSLQHVTAFECNQHMLKAARQIHHKLAPTIAIDWQSQNFSAQAVVSPADVVTMNYSLGEMSQTDIPSLMSQLYQIACKYIIIVEPGTSHGFNTVRRARDLLLSMGGSVISPCTHNQDCLMSDGDWCHFSERVTRTTLHQHTKRAVLNYENEKYSYIIVSKQPLSNNNAARVVKKPLQRSGHVRLDLCNNSGLHKKTYSRKDFDVYQQARRVMWGDLWDQD